MFCCATLSFDYAVMHGYSNVRFYQMERPAIGSFVLAQAGTAIEGAAGICVPVVVEYPWCMYFLTGTHTYCTHAVNYSHNAYAMRVQWVWNPRERERETELVRRTLNISATFAMVLHLETHSSYHPPIGVFWHRCCRHAMMMVIETLQIDLLALQSQCLRRQSRCGKD